MRINNIDNNTHLGFTSTIHPTKALRQGFSYAESTLDKEFLMAIKSIKNDGLNNKIRIISRPKKIQDERILIETVLKENSAVKKKVYGKALMRLDSYDNGKAENRPSIVIAKDTIDMIKDYAAKKIAQGLVKNIEEPGLKSNLAEFDKIRKMPPYEFFSEINKLKKEIFTA